jgi:hypothetical protein
VTGLALRTTRTRRLEPNLSRHDISPLAPPSSAGLVRCGPFRLPGYRYSGDSEEGLEPRCI